MYNRRAWDRSEEEKAKKSFLLQSGPLTIAVDPQNVGPAVELLLEVDPDSADRLLALNPAEAVRIAAASSTDLPLTTARRMLLDPSPRVRMALESNPALASLFAEGDVQ